MMHCKRGDDLFVN